MRVDDPVQCTVPLSVFMELFPNGLQTKPGETAWSHGFSLWRLLAIEDTELLQDDLMVTALVQRVADSFGGGAAT